MAGRIEAQAALALATAPTAPHEQAPEVVRGRVGLQEHCYPGGRGMTMYTPHRYEVLDISGLG